MKLYIILFLMYLRFSNASGQNPVAVTDQTIKIGGVREEEMYFGFATGDKIIFNFQEVNNKEVKEIEIIEYPSSSKFAEFKTSKITNKEININRQSVYKFRFLNGAIGGRICKVNIQRIPVSNATLNFNTNVTWITKQDTTWNTYTKDVIIGYDTVLEQKTRKELVKAEQREELIFDKPQRVHSQTNSNGNRTSLFFTLPANTFSLYKTEEVIAWAYWVGVGEEANKAWEKNTNTLKNLSKSIASYYSTPLGALAAGALVDLVVPSLGEDVSYWVTDQVNRDLFHASQLFRMFDSGTGVAGYRKFVEKPLCQGTYFICLLNDNVALGINASVKVVAIIETKVYEDKQITEHRITPRTEKQIVKEPKINSIRIPVIEN